MKAFKSLAPAFLLCALLFPGCTDDDDPKINLPDPTQKNQTAFADETTSGTIVFNASGDWTVTFQEPAYGVTLPAPTWIWLEKDGKQVTSGSAGSHTLTVKLDANYTGESRMARVTIHCDGEEIQIEVTQSGKTEAGKVPEKLVRSVISRSGEIQWFEYDNQNRVITYTYDFNDGDFDKYEYTYQTDRITCTYSEGENVRSVLTYQLNAQGDVASMSGTYGDRTFTMTYSYDTDGYLSTLSGGFGRYEYEWRDGDLIRLAEQEMVSGDSWEYTPSSFRNDQNVDLVMLMSEWEDPIQFLGYTGKSSAHLIESQIVRAGEEITSSQKYDYDFDDEDYVTKIYEVTGTGNKQLLYTITY